MELQLLFLPVLLHLCSHLSQTLFFWVEIFHVSCPPGDGFLLKVSTVLVGVLSVELLADHCPMVDVRLSCLRRCQAEENL